ncbi:site-specific tyrosine recombinase XerC [Caulifigura coniformis]|uniref:Site-specific tyrosine recombinase XerC n=1 Tax=Caulifigura coniformis TaxID=2527983 RepID=A0A517SCL0_9PLAN|nr:tyrosine-type recombinase/integrase [Caulifigura coniformis]QDT53853.1 site-specific tyrosine recombinase XerC [Caulifigura coniformis]
MPHFPKPFFKRSRGSWYVEIDRKQVKLGPDREGAFRRYHELMRQPEAKVLTSESVVALADQFLGWLKSHRSPDTFSWYQYRIERFCRRYPELTTDALKPFHVQQWVDSYPKLSRTSKRNYVRSVKRCLKWGVQQGYLASSPIEQLEVPGGDRKETFVTVEEYERLLAHLSDQAFRDLIVTTWETGCRPQESLRVEARHVDLKHSRWVFPKSESKGKRQPRVVYLTPAALEITQRRMNEFPTGPLFRNRNGNPWTPDSANCAFDRLRTRIFQRSNPANEELVAEAATRIRLMLSPERIIEGDAVPKSPRQLQAEARRKALAELVKKHVPRYSLYALRHSWATNALKSGVDPLTTAILLGHSDPSTLSRVYQHLGLNPAHMLEQARRASGGAAAS